MVNGKYFKLYLEGNKFYGFNIEPLIPGSFFGLLKCKKDLDLVLDAPEDSFRVIGFQFYDRGHRSGRDDGKRIICSGEINSQKESGNVKSYRSLYCEKGNSFILFIAKKELEIGNYVTCVSPQGRIIKLGVQGHEIRLLRQSNLDLNGGLEKVIEKIRDREPLKIK